jgi:ribosome-binding factor A
MSERKEKVEELVKRLAAEYLEHESNRDALVSVTHVDISPDFKNAMVYLSVMPESAEQSALDFAKRQRAGIRSFIKERIKTRVLPFIDVCIDLGEKHRQKIDNILK